jgi:hypothetical protein
MYPASAALAMLVLGDSAAYLLCDVDEASVRNLGEAAARFRLENNVESVLADGVDTLLGRSEGIDESEAKNTLVFVDPYHALDRSSRAGITSVDLACELVERGFKVVWWYGFDEESDRGWAWRAIAPCRTDERVAAWYGEIGPQSDAAPFLEDGMRGCGVVCLNCRREAVEAARAVGAQLAAAYADVAPDHVGALPGMTFIESALPGT